MCSNRDFQDVQGNHHVTFRLNFNHPALNNTPIVIENSSNGIDFQYLKYVLQIKTGYQNVLISVENHQTKALNILLYLLDGIKAQTALLNCMC